jgi:hypothetical protein
MIHEFAHLLRPTRLRTVTLAILGLLTAAACDNGSDPLATNEPTDTPAAVTEDSAGAAAVATDPSFAVSASYSGVPYGPFGLWSSYTSVKWGPSPFTASQNHTDASGIVTQIAAARSKGHRLVLAMTGGSSTNYTTNGKFDMAKWKNRMNTFKTTAIKNAVAAGVADGTIVGNSILDEPETPRWGGVLTKPLLDQMATYVKGIFPTLAVGVNHGPTGYLYWRTSEHYRVVDYVMNNYVWYISTGDAASWRDKIRAKAATDGAKVGFGVNVLDGGIKIAGCFKGTACCPVPKTGGIGTYAGAGGQNCRMTPTQVRDWSRALGTYACAMLVWQYDKTFLSNSANVTAFKDAASTLVSRPRPSCKRA